MLARMNELAAAGRSFAFETTLASRSFAPWLGRLTTHGYRTHLLFLWLVSPDLAVSRVAERVRVGGGTTYRRRRSADVTRAGSGTSSRSTCRSWIRGRF